MKFIVIVSALAVFALGAVVGRASVPTPAEPRTAAQFLTPTYVVPVDPNRPIEKFIAI